MNVANLSNAQASLCHQILPVRPRPFFDELSHGFLARVAFANGYETPAQLWTALHFKDKRTADFLRNNLMLPKSEWSSLSGPWPRYCNFEDLLPDGLNRADYINGSFRWCPQCLANMPYLRSAWGLKFCVTCPDHGVYLLGACPRCHRAQKTENFCYLRCTCGQPLLACGCSKASDEVLALQKAFLRVPSLQEGIILPRLKPEHWILLFERIAALTEPSHKGRTGQVSGLHNLSTAIKIIQQVSKILTAWPIGFHTLLSDLQAKADPSFSLPQTFGRLYRWLYVDLSAKELSFLREGFEKYLQEHWWGLVCRRNRRLCRKKEESPRSTIQEAAIVSGNTPARIKQLHLAGLIEATKVHYQSGRQSWSIPSKSVAELTALAADSMDLRAAAAYLALPKHRVRDLIDSGLIHPLLSVNAGNSSTWMLSRSELKTLGRSTHRLTTAGSSAPSDSVTILHALKTWRLETGAFPDLVRALANGKILGIAKSTENTPLGKMSASAKCLREWLELWRKEHLPSMSIPDAARALRLKEEVAYDLVEIGILITQPQDAGSARRISIAEITRFQQTYVAASTLSRMLNTSSRALLERSDVAPVTGPSVDGHRQYFFKRSDADLILAQANTNRNLRGYSYNPRP